MQYVIFFAIVIAIVIIAKLLAWPLKVIIKLLANIFIGLVILLCINTFGVGIGLYIPFNIVTSLVAGLLGIPGVLLLVIIHYVM